MSVGPFEAEARRKDKEEDVLTSRVFGILNRIDKIAVLGLILRNLGIKIPDEEIKQAEIRLWEEYDGTIPDAVIETKSTLIFVECKLESPLIIEQLKREYKEGIAEEKDFYLLCITKHFLEPLEIKQARRECPKIVWTSWQELNAILRRTSESEKLDIISKGLISDLLKLLDAKGLRGFAGFKEINLKQIVKGTNAMHSYFNEISIFIRELQSQLDPSEIVLKTRKGSWFHRDGRGTRLEGPDDWITSHLTFAFGAKDWPFTDFWSSSYLFVRFYLVEGKDKVLFGYSMKTKGNSRNIDALIEKKNEICSFLKESRSISLVFIRSWREYVYDLYSGDEIVEELFKRENLEDAFRVEFCSSINDEDFSNRKMLEVVRDTLVNLRKAVKDLQLEPRIEEEEEIPQEEEKEI
ncbi:hypothetical protein CW705_02800 [Candidatus Bathyarchaeota archaeon]|nr:MAG: hypothetical protein CW705_02800 [Candidatus Bathyarchaeota archaeon]